MSRCKSAPTLLDTDMPGENNSKIKRHGTLPTTLLKRTDITFFNSPGSEEKKKSNSVLKECLKNSKEDGAEKEKQLIQFMSSLDESNAPLNLKKNDSNVVQNLLVEVENLNKKVRLLESENCALFYKLNNKNIRLVNNRDYLKIENETNLTAQIAKPETDSDEYKV